MEQRRWNPRKVVIVGAGAVGSTFAYALAQSGMADEIAIVDLNRDLVEGQVLDLAHGMPFFPSVRIFAGQPEDYRDARVIVITAGGGQQPGQTRLDLLNRNAGIIEKIVDDITAQESNAVLLVVTNPVDVLTYIALKRSGWPRNRVIGSGTVLDSARFRYLISQRLDVGVHNVHAYIMGEHGDSEFAAWSLTNVGGVPIEQFFSGQNDGDWLAHRGEIEEEVRNSAYHIIDNKGATNFAVGLALVRIVGAILRNQSSILTVSVRLDGEYGLRGVCLSIPCQVTEEGVARIPEVRLAEEEMEKLRHSATVLRRSLSQLQP